MKMITFCSFKGGAGKTTSLMAIASCLENRGYKVGLLEADDNYPMEGWKKDGTDNKLWSENIHLYDATTVEKLQISFEAADDSGVDFLLVDTRGGASEINTVLIANSAMVIVPTQLTHLDVKEALATIKFIASTLADNENDASVVVLKTRVPAKLKKSNKEAEDYLGDLPCFDRVMMERDSFQSQRKLGLLHKTESLLRDIKGRALEARQYDEAIQVVEGVTDDILSAI